MGFLYFLIGLILTGLVVYWQDELGVKPKLSSDYRNAAQIEATALIWMAVGTFLFWPITSIIGAAIYFRKRKLERES